MKIAIVHDYLHQFGGAERCVEAFHKIFPEAPIYTSIFNPFNFPESFKKMAIRTSFMQRIPFIFKNFRIFFALYPLAFLSFNLSGYDVVLSSSSAFAKGIRKRKGAVHVCYCYNPMRFVWRYSDYIKKENFPGLINWILPFVLSPIKCWDLYNSKNVDHFIAISKIVSQRIKQIYSRDSIVIYPPIDTKQYAVSAIDGDYFLIVSRLVGYKRIDLAVEAVSRLGLPLIIAGEGPSLAQLKRNASANITFLGKVSDQKLKKLLSECRALILTGEEDFGMTPLEAAASGRPTIAYAKGGALETVVDEITGIFFGQQSAESLMKAIEKFDKMDFDKKTLRAHAEKFDKEIFKDKIRRFFDENKIL
ncbi:glycosyltransferase [Candidatus Saganbacteria bacterium]|nr:glycosyltransferase [Candidatus Saganbacteria bacterium]